MSFTTATGLKKLGQTIAKNGDDLSTAGIAYKDAKGHVLPLDETLGNVAAKPRLLLIDGHTLAVRHSVPLPGHARHLQLFAPGGPVLVPAEDASRLVEVSLPNGRISASVPDS